MTAAKSFQCSNIDASASIAPTVWAIIPARGGSKRLPRKNIMSFAGGDSLTARTVKSAVESGCFSRVLVSTDSAEIAEEGRRAGALVPFIRPACLADDQASSVDVLLHAVDELHQNFPDDRPVAICLLQVTSPMLTAQHVREAVTLFISNGFNSLSSMTSVEQYPEWMFRVESSTGLATPESADGITCPARAIPQRYIENGAIYLVKSEWLAVSSSLYDFSRHGCYVMQAEDSIDIDTLTDWEYASFIAARRHAGEA